MNRSFREVLINEDKGIVSYLASKHYTEPIKCMIGRKVLLTNRNTTTENEFDYDDMNKENLENLFLESFTNQDINYIEQCIKVNNWTLKDLYKEIKFTGRCTLQAVGCPNKHLN